jgi:hypothetical protein
VSDNSQDPKANSLGPSQEIDPDLLKKALDQVRAVARGNGIDAGRAEIVKFDGGVYRFSAHAAFKIRAKTSERRVSGKENGEAVAYGQMAQTVQAAINKATADPDARAQILDTLRKRADLGFAGNGLVVNLGGLSRTYVSHIACSTCGARGKMPCPACNGRGEEQCPRCHGRREMTCPACRGTKYTGSGATRTACQRCYGRGQIPCTHCQHSGMVTCHICSGQGAVGCANCKATGWQSIVTRLDVSAQGWFDWDSISLPPQLKDVMREHALELVPGGHIKAELDEEAAGVARVAGDELPVGYTAQAPWGRIEFEIGAQAPQAISCYLFGYKPTLLFVPPFLARAITPGRDALRRAGLKEADAAKEIRAALRYRFISETVAATARFPLKKAIELIHARYPFGIEPTALREIALESKNGLARLTALPRRKGLAIGLAAAAALYLGWMLSPLRAQIIAHLSARLGPPAAEGAADLAVFLAGVCIATFLVRLMAAKILHDTLGPLLKNKSGQGKRHSTGKTTGMLGSCLAYGAALYILAGSAALLLHKPAPTWVARPVGVAIRAYYARANKPTFEQQLQKEHEKYDRMQRIEDAQPKPPPRPAPRLRAPQNINLPDEGE